jgi:hypothetical protein
MSASARSGIAKADVRPLPNLLEQDITRNGRPCRCGFFFWGGATKPVIPAEQYEFTER